MWGNTYKTHIHGLQIIQKRIIRSIYRLPYNCHTHANFAKAKILRIEELIYLNTVKHMHKTFLKTLPQNIQQFYSINPRHPTRFLMKFSRTNIITHIISNVGIKIWNTLDSDLKAIKNH